jgi:hypothetical protein
MLNDGAGRPPIQVRVQSHGGVDLGEVSECLGDVARLFAGDFDLLGAQAEVVGLPERVVVRDGAYRERALVSEQTVRGHWIAARTLAQRDLSREERRRIVRDGWPLVTACAVPLLFLGLKALLGVETAVAVDLTLAVNTVLLFIVGWQMGKAGGLTGAPLALSSGATGPLGVALILLKTLTH